MLLTHKSPRRVQDIKASRKVLLLHFPYNGCEFQVDSSSLTLIAGRALKITRQQFNDEAVSDQIWRAVDNSFVTFTAEEFLVFAEAADEYVEQVFQQSWIDIDAI